MWNWLLACQDKLFLNNCLDVKENDEHALDFALRLSHLLRSRWVWNFSNTCVQFMLSYPNACLIVASVCHTSFKNCIKFDAHSLSDLSQNCITPNTGLQLHEILYSLPRYATTITDHWITLLQLLYTWQCQSQKLHTAIFGTPLLLLYIHPKLIQEVVQFRMGDFSCIRLKVKFQQFHSTNKQTPWPLVRKRTIPTERSPLVGDIYCQLLRIEGCRVVSAADPLRSLISVF
jgi:hypothetical protein